jgi:hypothetical protein
MSTLRSIPFPARLAIAAASLLLLTSACSGSNPLPNGIGAGGSSAGQCVDKDKDGYGVGCPLGNDCNDNDPTSTNECFGCSSGQAGCPCATDGLKTECGIPLGKVGNEVSCQMGTSTCQGGQWGQCIADTGSSTQTYRAPARSAQALGGGSTCAANPCDPYCMHWNDTPDPSMGNDAGVVGTDAGLSIKGNGATLGCGSVTQKAEPIPLDLYVMLDDSGSMNEYVNSTQTRWQAVTTALKGFVNDPNSAGINVAVQYFGAVTQTCTSWTCTSQNCFTGYHYYPWYGWWYGYDCECNSYTCNSYGWSMAGDPPYCQVSHYATPDVAMGALPGNAGSVSTSLNNHYALTSTPTLPAEQGAVQFAQNWKTANPTHTVAVVLATDGEPNDCDGGCGWWSSASCFTNHVAQAAAAGYGGTPSIKTYVIGCGSSTGNLDQVAAAGGTTKAFIASDANSTSDFIAAMNAIRNTALPCTYTVPTPPVGQQIDYSTLNIQYTSGGGTVTSMTQVANAAACTGNAWYFTDASKTTMALCPGICSTVQGDTGAQVNVVYSCVQHYDPGVFTRTYDASSVCPTGTAPYWGAWTWSSSLPSDSGIDFKVAVASTAAGLSSAPLDSLQFTNPPGPAGLAGQPIGARAATNTENGSAVIEKTLIAHSRNGSAPFLKVESYLNPSSDQTKPPTLISWDLQVSCQPAQ